MKSLLGFAPLRFLTRPPAQHLTTRSLPELLRSTSTQLHAPFSQTARPQSLAQLQRPTVVKQRWGQLHRDPRLRQARGIFGGSIITHYIDLPKDYKDEDGLPFRRKDLSDKEVAAVFGRGITTPAANKLLRILHGRRVAGTLMDPSLQRNTAHFSPVHKQKALEYLRKHVKVDEIANAGLHAEDELDRLDRAAAAEEEAKAAEHARAAAAGEGNAADTTDADAAVDEAPPALNPVYGKSVLDEVRARNIALAKTAEAKRAEERRLKELEEQARAHKLGPVAKQDKSKPRELSPLAKKYAEKATSTLTEPPKMTAFQRLWPSALFTLGVVGACAAFAVLYEPPGPKDARLWPSISPATATVAGLVAVNLAVWLAWYVPFAWPVLNRWFILVPATVRPLSLLGACFSHQGLGHLAANMVILAIVGTALHDDIGRGNFLAIYTAGGVVGYMASLTRIVLARRFDLTSLGASGGAWAVTMAYFWIHRFEEMKVLGLPPEPYSGIDGLAFIGFFLGLHVLAVISKNQVVDIAGHFGGMAVGFIAGKILGDRRDAKLKAMDDARVARPDAETASRERLGNEDDAVGS